MFVSPHPTRKPGDGQMVRSKHKDTTLQVNSVNAEPQQIFRIWSFLLGVRWGFYRAGYREYQTGVTFISRLLTSGLHSFFCVHKSLRMLLWKAAETCIKEKR